MTLIMKYRPESPRFSESVNSSPGSSFLEGLDSNHHLNSLLRCALLWEPRTIHGSFRTSLLLSFPDTGMPIDRRGHFSRGRNSIHFEIFTSRGLDSTRFTRFKWIGFVPKCIALHVPCCFLALLIRGRDKRHTCREASGAQDCGERVAEHQRAV